MELVAAGAVQVQLVAMVIQQAVQRVQAVLEQQVALLAHQ
jgi:hypothetical protein